MMEFLRNHGTKVLGFAQVTVGVLATATSLLPEVALQWILLLGGLLTAWRGWVNSALLKADESDNAGA